MWSSSARKVQSCLLGFRMLARSLQLPSFLYNVTSIPILASLPIPSIDRSQAVHGCSLPIPSIIHSRGVQGCVCPTLIVISRSVPIRLGGIYLPKKTHHNAKQARVKKDTGTKRLMIVRYKYALRYHGTLLATQDGSLPLITKMEVESDVRCRYIPKT